MVAIRLIRLGRTKCSKFRIVVVDKRCKRDGRFIEKIGTYNPQSKPATIQLKDDIALKWLLQGAQPTDTVRSILSSQGVMLRKHLQEGVRKGAITQVIAEQRFASWKADHKNKKSSFERLKEQVIAIKQIVDTKEEQSLDSEIEKSIKEKKEVPTIKVVEDKKSTKSQKDLSKK